MAFLAIAITLLLVSSVWYLWHVNRAIDGTPPEALKAAAKPWTAEQIQEAYRNALESPTDVRKFLPVKQHRRYVVVGGSGLVGGWIVQHLIWRGEDPRAIRIMDLRASTRREVAEYCIDFQSLDVTNSESVSQAFQAPWPQPVANLPLTVFHCAAYINAAPRKKVFLEPFWRVNVVGTQNTLDAAKAAGASVYISTSSAAIGLRPPQLFLPPWRRWPVHYWQYLPNADPPHSQGLDAPLEEFIGCYAFSKAAAEKIVRTADDKMAGFRTGCIRPGHAIYGAGVENPSSVTWDYLRRGISPTWMWRITANFVNAQNVSIAHLALEKALLASTVHDVGGRAYCCTDPGPPITYGHLYNLLIALAHPTTVPGFPRLAPVPILLLSYVCEAYALLRHYYARFLPALSGNLESLTPGMMNVTTEHILYDDSLIRKEIGYVPALETLEGMSLAVLDWNQKIESNLKEKKTL